MGISKEKNDLILRKITLIFSKFPPLYVFKNLEIISKCDVVVGYSIGEFKSQIVIILKINKKNSIENNSKNLSNLFQSFERKSK